MRNVCARAAVGRVLALVALVFSVIIRADAVAPIDSGPLTLHTVYTNIAHVEGEPLPGDQYDPHVDGDIASYTSGDEIRYYDFVTGDDLAVPKLPDVIDRLSGVSNGRIVYSRDEVDG